MFDGGTGVERALEHCDAPGVDGGVGVTMPLGRVVLRAGSFGGREACPGKLCALPTPFHLKRI